MVVLAVGDSGAGGISGSSQAAGDARGEERRGGDAVGDTDDSNAVGSAPRSVLIDIVLATSASDILTGCPRRVTCRCIGVTWKKRGLCFLLCFYQKPYAP